MNINKCFFKYFVYYPVIFVRGEWVYVHLKKLNRTQYYQKNKIEEMQLVRLNSLISHARKTVPFYAHLPSEKLTSLNQISELPLLEKSQIRESAESLWSRKGGLYPRKKTSGGSTGAPVTIRKNAGGVARELAATWRGYSWAGVDIGDKQARFWGVPSQRKDRIRARLIDFVTNRIRFSAFSFSNEDFKKYLSILSSRSPRYLYGYVSMIKQLSEFKLSSKEKYNISVDVIITTSEVLNNVDRKVISKAFDAPVFNEYGCGEVGTIAHECEHGSMHINSENMLVEIINEYGKAAESGEILVTDLINYSMPLIRYRLKDFATISEKKCACGRGLHVMENIHGREYDTLLNSSGDKFHGEFFLYMVEELKAKGVVVDGVQFHQINDDIHVDVVCGDKWFETIASYLTSRLKKDFDESFLYSIKRVDDIARESSGKLRVVKRSVL